MDYIPGTIIEGIHTHKQYTVLDPARDFRGKLRLKDAKGRIIAVWWKYNDLPTMFRILEKVENE